VRGARTTQVDKHEVTRVEANRVANVGGNEDIQIGGDLATVVDGRERRSVGSTLELATFDDTTHRAEGSVTAVVGKHDAKRSYTLHVHGIADISGSDELLLSSEKALTLKVGKSSIRITEHRIEITSEAITATGGGAGLNLAKDVMKVTAPLHAEIQAKSVSMVSEGTEMHLNPPETKDDDAPDAKPPTLIELKDDQGKPIPWQRFVIELEDGSEIGGMVDEQGKAQVQIEGSGKIRFPDLLDTSMA
jgi:type VI secretion system secreted protein VgrG